MKKNFIKFLKEHHWFDPEFSFLLAVSGGLDSVVMTHLFAQSGIRFGIGHINHSLRGEASNGDEALVKELAETLGAPFYSVKIPTKETAEKDSKSLQEVARDLRYSWLEKIRNQEGYHYICTAHHADDALETLLLNLVKGTGIRGLAGVPVKRGRIIRPLLFATREQLAQFQSDQKFDYREDESNQSLQYDRNKMRLEVIPILKSMNPSLSATSTRTLDNLRGNLALYELFLNSIREQLVIKEKEHWKIELPAVRKLPAPKTVLYELLSPVGLNSDQVQDLWDAQEKGHPGRTFVSANYEVLLDRTNILIRKYSPSSKFTLELHADESHYLLPDGRLEIQYLATPPVTFSKENTVAVLDAGLLKFPLQWRHWKEGDIFMPLGMSGQRKKVQDFFTDQKLNRFEKEKIWILESSGQIAWIAGHRIDENYKITPATKSCWKFRYIPNNVTE